MIIAVICSGFGLMVVFITGIVVITLADHDPAVLINFIFGIVNLLGFGGIGGAMFHLNGRLKIVEANTNHTLEKLTDAVIASPPPQTGTPSGTE